MKKKQVSTYFILLISFIYFEILFRIFAVNSLITSNWIYIFFYISFLTFLFSFFSYVFSKKINKILFFVLFFLISMWYTGEIVFKNSFHVYFSVSTTFFADQAISFAEKIFEILFSNFVFILLIFLPFVFSFLFRENISFEKKKGKELITILSISFISYLLFLGFVLDSRDVQYSPKELYFERMNNPFNKETFGALPSVFIEIRKMLFPKTEIIYQVVREETDKEDIPLLYKDHVFDIDFESLILKEKDETIKKMHTYFLEETPTTENEYTGFFKDKNLILIMAESFHSIAVDKSLTPTLYKLTHEGFVFENFYSPVILSTIGGEFQELTGLYPDLTTLSNVWREGPNYFPFGYGTVFKRLGYEVNSYHNHKYQFQNRDTYLKSLGFTNFLGCGNGLEKRIDCNLWPESDIEMMKETVGDYINSDKFFTYYVTVSGHMSYNFKKNDMAIKNKKYVESLPYSEDIKAYLATQMELDRALEEFLNTLEEKGKLDDTVIALVGDHYPYDISLSHINEIADPKRDDTIEINRSHFILWNPKMERVTIETSGGNMDVLPTILNLFDIPYDSRLIMGRDLLSKNEGLVIFADSSWVSDKGTYYASKGLFVPKEEVVSEEYIKRMNQIVSNRVNLSKLILEKDYYRKVLGE